MNDTLALRASRTVPVAVPSSPVTPEEALANARAAFQGDELAATTWVNKYALRDAAGNLVEASPADMHRRMAREFARIESRYAPVPAEKRASLSTYGQARERLDEQRIFSLFDGFRDVVPQGSVCLLYTSPSPRD